MTEDEKIEAEIIAEESAKADTVSTKSAKKNPNEYKEIKTPKYVQYKAAPEVVEKKGKVYSGKGLVDFKTNGNMKVLGEEGRIWPTPAERAQAFVDSGHGEIVGINKEWQKKVMATKKGH